MKMCLSFVASVALMALVEPAAAQTTSGNKAAAESLFDQGKRLLAEKNISQACLKFEASQELEPGLGTLLYLADCYERDGKTASAWAAFKEAESVAGREQDAKRKKVASVRALGLEPRLAKLLVRGDPTLMNLQGLEIRLNGSVVPKAQWGSEVPIDPGQQRIEATAPGYERYEQTLELPPGPSTGTFDIPPLKPLPVSPTPSQAAAPATPPTEKSAFAVTPADVRPSSGQKTVGLVVSGVGLLSTGIGGFFGLRAISKNSDSEETDKCPTPKSCFAPGLKLRNEALDAAKVSTIAFGVGAALVTTGVVLYLTAPDEAQAGGSSGTLFVATSINPRGTSLNLGGVW